MRTQFEVIKDKAIRQLVWNDESRKQFDIANAQKHPVFGKNAIALGEPPFKAVCTFLNGQVQGFRSDYYKVHPNQVEALKELYNRVKKYVAAGKAVSVKIFDNRDLLSAREILNWSKETDTVTNLLPLYSQDFILKNKK